MPQPKLITFDLDNTLWDVEVVVRKAEADMVSWLAANADASLRHYQPDTLQVLRAETMAEHPDKRHDLTFMRIRILYKVMRLAGFKDREASKLAKAAFDVFFAGRNRVEFFPGAVELLQRLSPSYTLYALTNGNADITRTGLDAYLRGAISSADVGQSKPHAAMFEAALALVQAAPHEAIHVGDHLIDDIEGAHNAGMHTVWVNLKGMAGEDAGQQPTETVTHLLDVEAAIERIESL